MCVCSQMSSFACTHSIKSALRTPSKKFQPVAFDGEIGDGCYAGKLFFAETGVYLAHFATGGTGDVVVMATGVMTETETVRAIGKFNAVKHMEFLQYLHGAKDCCPSNIGVTRQRHIP